MFRDKKTKRFYLGLVLVAASIHVFFFAVVWQIVVTGWLPYLFDWRTFAPLMIWFVVLLGGLWMMTEGARNGSPEA